MGRGVYPNNETRSLRTTTPAWRKIVSAVMNFRRHELSQPQ